MGHKNEFQQDEYCGNEYPDQSEFLDGQEFQVPPARLETPDERFYHQDEYNLDVECGLGSSDADDADFDEPAAAVADGPWFHLPTAALRYAALVLAAAAVLLAAGGHLEQTLSTATDAITGAVSIGTTAQRHECTPGDWIVDTPATCVAEGSRHRECTVCGKLLETQPIPLLAQHDYTAQTTSPATCTQDGVVTYTCQSCGDSYNQTVPATGHDYKQQTSPAACTQDGVVTYTCSVCGDSYTEPIPATGHAWQSYTSVYPTCYSTGEQVYVCDLCGQTFTETLGTTEHTWLLMDRHIDPTCEEPGYTYYQCGVCGELYIQEIAPLGHDWVASSTTPSMNMAGMAGYFCQRCGAITAAP